MLFSLAVVIAYLYSVRVVYRKRFQMEQQGTAIAIPPSPESPPAPDPLADPTSPESLLARLQCPECFLEGKENVFPTKQGLSMHRNRAHGIVSSRSGSRKRSTAKRSTAKRTTARRGRGQAVDNGLQGLDTNGLIRLVFPGGIPARADVLGRIHNLVTEAESLYKVGSKNR